jgi:hypothetical protein
VSAVESAPRGAERPPGAVRDPEVASLVRSLSTTASVPPAMIEWMVAEELVRFRGARVRNFIPILVERAVRRRLAAP